MAMVYPMQMLLAGFTLLLAFPFAASSTITSTSKDEIKCDSCTPVVPSPPPPVVLCPPPPSPPVQPPPSPPPPKPSPPPPACPSCIPLPPCNPCQVPNTPVTPATTLPGQQPGVIGGGVYSPPNEAVPYFPYSQYPPHSESAASFTLLELKHVISIIFLLLSATFSVF